jgi:hypothetical protein
MFLEFRSKSIVAEEYIEGGGGKTFNNPDSYLINYHLPLNGNNGNGRSTGTGGSGGAGILLHGYADTAGAGGQGGSNTSGGHNGGNGVIIIREISLE